MSSKCKNENGCKYYMIGSKHCAYLGLHASLATINQLIFCDTQRVQKWMKVYNA
jgi:hypothetical protein